MKSNDALLGYFVTKIASGRLQWRDGAEDRDAFDGICGAAIEHEYGVDFCGIGKSRDQAAG